MSACIPGEDEQQETDGEGKDGDDTLGCVILQHDQDELKAKGGKSEEVKLCGQ